MIGTLNRRALFGRTATIAVAAGIASVPLAAAIQLDTPFRLAAVRYRAAEARFNSLPSDLESGDPAAFEREEQAYTDALHSVDETPVGSWKEFSEAFEIACDGGSSLPGEDLMMKLLGDVRRLAKGGLN